MSRQIYSGEFLEGQLLGETGKKPNFNPEYEKFHKSLEDVKLRQPGDPTDPKPRFANDLHATIAEKITPDDYSKLKFYTAVNSLLDRYHGIDAFFELEQNGKLYRVTFDLTKNTSKDYNLKSDLLIFIDEDDLDTISIPGRYEKMIERIADEVNEAFERKIKREQNI